MTEMDSDAFEALQNRLLAYHETGRFAEGERLTRQALADHPEDPDVLGWLASFLGEQQRVDEGMEVIEQAITLSPEDDRLLYLKSSLLFLSGDNEQAMAASSAALELDPDDAENLLKQAGFLTLDGRHDQALDLLERALELDPDNPELHATLGACHMRAMNWREAESAFEAALAARPDNGEVWKMLGLVRASLGKVRPSLVAHTNAVRSDPSLDVRFYLAWPIMNAYYRSRWIQPLIVALLVCAPTAPPWNAIVTGAAGLLLLGAIADALAWPFRGGTTSWRAMLMRPAGQLLVSAACAIVLCGVFAMLGLAIVTGSAALAWWTLLPIAVLWVLNLLECAFGPDEDADAGIPLRMMENIGYTIGYDLMGLRKRLRGLRLRGARRFRQV